MVGRHLDPRDPAVSVAHEESLEVRLHLAGCQSLAGERWPPLVGHVLRVLRLEGGPVCGAMTGRVPGACGARLLQHLHEVGVLRVSLAVLPVHPPRQTKPGHVWVQQGRRRDHRRLLASAQVQQVCGG